MQDASVVPMSSTAMATITAIGLSNLPAEIRSLSINLLQDPNTPCSSKQLKQLALQVSCGFKFLSLECRRCFLQRILKVACELHLSESSATTNTEDDATQLVEVFFTVLDLNIHDQECRQRVLQAIWDELFGKVAENHKLLPTVVMQTSSPIMPTIIIPVVLPEASLVTPEQKPKSRSATNLQSSATSNDSFPQSQLALATEAVAKPENSDR